jgi:hypothetical protein
MRLHSVRNSCGCLLAALLLSPPQGFAAEPAERSRASMRVAQSIFGAFEYSRKVAEYNAARQQYETEADTYWDLIANNRRARAVKRRNNQGALLQDYVLSQPPVYAGPPRPVDPNAPVEEPTPRKYVPVVADLLEAAAQEFRFAPQQPQSEIEYKRAYARVAAAAGITKEQAVRIYAFEASGNGKYDVQAGLGSAKPDAQAITTALGYNQLLNANSVELMAENGDQFIRTLRTKASALTDAQKQTLARKIGVLQRMVAFSKTVPDVWSEHEKLANTPKGLGVHAMNLDVDVGPLLQIQKLVNSLAFARSKGYKGVLSAAELEMMNLTGDGTGFDILVMPPAMRELVPTANFFQRSGYERNPIAIRNDVVAKLLSATNAKMDEEVKLQGAKDLAAAF